MAKDEINAFLGTGTIYEGKLNFQGSVRIDGIFTGEVQSEGTLIVGKDAKVQGQVWVGQLVLSGNFQGEIQASKKVVLHKTAHLVGSMDTPVLVIEEGAVIEGQVTMNAAKNRDDKKSGKKSGAMPEKMVGDVSSPVGGTTSSAAESEAK